MFWLNWCWQTDNLDGEQTLIEMYNVRWIRSL